MGSECVFLKAPSHPFAWGNWTGGNLQSWVPQYPSSSQTGTAEPALLWADNRVLEQALGALPSTWEIQIEPPAPGFCLAWPSLSCGGHLGE